MFELQTDLLEWLQQRKKGRQGIGFHGAGPWSDEVDLPGTAGCVQMNLGYFWNLWQWSYDEPYHYRFYHTPKDKFDKLKPKEITWDYVPEDRITFDLEAHPHHFAWVYGRQEPRKIHQGSARFIKR